MNHNKTQSDRRRLHCVRDTLKAAALADSQGDPSERLVDGYLEKLIQIPCRLPRLSASEIEMFRCRL